MIHLDSFFLQCLGYALFHSVWQLLLLGWLSRRLLRAIPRSNSRVRYRIAGLILLLAPTILIGTFLYQHQSRVDLETSSSTGNGNQIRLAEFRKQPSQIHRKERELEATLLSQQIHEESTQKLRESWIEQQERDANASVVSIDLKSMADPMAAIAAVFWLIGICCSSLKPLAEFSMLRKLRMTGTSCIPKALRESFFRLKRQMQIRRSVQLKITESVLVPTVIGYFRPLILIPSRSLSLLTRVELEAVLLHELAHVRRCDDWAVLLQRTVKTLFFYHPSVGRLSQIIDQEREKSCDDLAAALIESGEPLALALTKLATGHSYNLQLRASDGDLLERITRLAGMDTTVSASPRRTSAWWLAPSIMTLLVFAAFLSSDLTGQETKPPINQSEITAKAQLMISHSEDAIRPIMTSLTPEEAERLSAFMRQGTRLPDEHPLKPHLERMVAIEAVGISKVYGVDLLTHDLRTPLITEGRGNGGESKVSFLGSEGIRMTKENPLFANDAVGMLGLTKEQVIQIWDTHLNFLETVDQVFEMPMSGFDNPESIETQIESIALAFDMRSASLNASLSEEQSLMLASLRDYWAIEMDRNFLLSSEKGFLGDALKDKGEKVNQLYAKLVAELKWKQFDWRVDAMFRLIHEFPDSEQTKLQEYFGKRVPTEKLLELDALPFFSAKSIDSLKAELEITPEQGDEIARLQKQHANERERLTEERSLQNAEKLVEYYRNGPALVSRQISEVRETLLPAQLEVASNVYRQLQTARLGLSAHLRHPEFESGTEIATQHIRAAMPAAKKMDAEIDAKIRKLATEQLKTFAQEHLPEQVQRIDAVFGTGSSNPH